MVENLNKSINEEVNSLLFFERLSAEDINNVNLMLILISKIREKVIPARKAVIVAVGSSVEALGGEEPNDIDLRLVIDGPYDTDSLTKLMISIFNYLPFDDKEDRVVFSEPDTNGRTYRSVTMNIRFPRGKPVDLILPTRGDPGSDAGFDWGTRTPDEWGRIDRYLLDERSGNIWLGYTDEPSAFSVLKVYSASP